MGSFSYLSVSGYPIFEIKNSYLDEIVNLIFQPSDYIEEKRPLNTRNKLFWGDSYLAENGDYIFKGFKQNAKVCKQRLEIFGMNLIQAKRDFSEVKKSIHKEGYYDFAINKVTFDKYLVEINYVLKNRIKSYDEIYTNLRDTLIMLDLSIGDLSYSAQLYSIFSQLEDDEVIEYDLTDIIAGGYVNDKRVLDITIEKIIILTEGKTDVEFISNSLRLLYPHLLPYYHFINFDEYKVESSASALVKLVLSFAAANIKHPIIVLFDNDTTGIMEMKTLISKKIPSNFKVLKLPDIKLAVKYPTIGPTGIKKMNINGFACGIEMYFGEDVLKKGDEFLPILWKGYNEKEKKYQGEISDKGFIQNKFREKLKLFPEANFSDMNFLLMTIFNAFQTRTQRFN